MEVEVEVVWLDEKGEEGTSRAGRTLRSRALMMISERVGRNRLMRGFWYELGGRELQELDLLIS